MTLKEVESQKLIIQALQKHQGGYYKEAEDLYKKILRLSPKNSIALYLLGTLYAQLNNLDSAIIFINKSLKLNNNNADAFYNLGNILQKQKKLDKAINTQPKKWSLGEWPDLRKMDVFKDQQEVRNK